MPPVHPREFKRLLSLGGLGSLDEERDPLFDDIARQAAAICGTPIALVSVVREHDQVFIGNSGMEVSRTGREDAICAYTILESETLVVEDIIKDGRFAHFATVQGSPHLRFYAGAPILDPSGLPLGTVCALDTKPHEMPSTRLFALQRLAATASVLLEARRFVIDLLGPGARPAAIQSAVARLDRVLEPLFEASRSAHSMR